MDSSGFSRLSPELRNEIYKLVVDVGEPIHLLCRTSDSKACLVGLSRHGTGGKRLALLRTCKQVNGEARGLARSINKFVLHTCKQHPSKALDCFAKQVGRKTVQIVHIKLDVYSFRDYCGKQMTCALAKIIANTRYLTLRFAARLHPDDPQVAFELDFKTFDGVRSSTEACAASFAAMVPIMKAETRRPLYPWMLQLIEIEKTELADWLDRLGSQIERLGGDRLRWS